MNDHRFKKWPVKVHYGAKDTSVRIPNDIADMLNPKPVIVWVSIDQHGIIHIEPVHEQLSILKTPPERRSP